MCVAHSNIHIHAVGFGTPARGKAAALAVAAVQFTVYDATAKACEIFSNATQTRDWDWVSHVEEPVRQSTDQSVG